MKKDTSTKVKQAVKLLKSVSRRAGETIEICYSGGKDSDVILRLANLADIPFKAIHRVSGIDRPGTLKHCANNGVELHRAGQTFFDVVRRRGMPTRRKRFCCEVLREYRIMLFAVLGVRRDESSKRHALYKEPIQCRVYHSRAQGYVQQVLPILGWTLEDEEDFIIGEHIKLHQHYYDDDGHLCLNKRLGCIGCPLASDRGLSEYKEYPKMLRQTIRAAQDYYNSLPESAPTRRLFADAYEIAEHNLFFSSYYDFASRIFRDSKQQLEDYFGIEL